MVDQLAQEVGQAVEVVEATEVEAVMEAMMELVDTPLPQAQQLILHAID